MALETMLRILNECIRGFNSTAIVALFILCSVCITCHVMELSKCQLSMPLPLLRIPDLSFAVRFVIIINLAEALHMKILKQQLLVNAV